MTEPISPSALEAEILVATGAAVRAATDAVERIVGEYRTTLEASPYSKPQMAIAALMAVRNTVDALINVWAVELGVDAPMGEPTAEQRDPKIHHPTRYDGPIVDPAAGWPSAPGGDNRR